MGRISASSAREPRIARNEIDPSLPSQPKPARTWNLTPETKNVDHKRGTSFIRYRRQYISNTTWYGGAVLIVGLGSLSLSEGWKLLFPSLLMVAGGSCLVWSGVWRAVHRIDPASGKSHPSRPW
jgi:hypothetical protein